MNGRRRENNYWRGIAWAQEKSRKYVLVAEACGYTGLKALRETLKWRIKEMAKRKEIEIDEIDYRTEDHPCRFTIMATS